MFPHSNYIIIHYNFFMKKNTYKELATKSQVSISVLSRYFNNGYVSKAKKARIAQAIREMDYVRNRNASLIKKKEKEDTIVLRTFVISQTQDNIIDGILSYLNNEEMIVKYSKRDQSHIVNNIEWVLTLNAKNLIVFAPINPDQKFLEILKKAKKYTNIAIYNFENEICSSTTNSYKDVYKKLSKQIYELDFIYENPNDIESFIKKIKELKKYFAKVNLIQIQNFRDSSNYKMYQSDSLRLNLLNHYKIRKNIIISYRKPILGKSSDIWIFQDHFQIGIILCRLLENDAISNVQVKAKIIENWTKKNK